MPRNDHSTTRRELLLGAAATALYATLLHHGLLYGMQVTGFADTFNACNVPTLCLQGKHHAGVNRFAIK